MKQAKKCVHSTIIMMHVFHFIYLSWTKKSLNFNKATDEAFYINTQAYTHKSMNSETEVFITIDRRDFTSLNVFLQPD